MSHERAMHVREELRALNLLVDKEGRTKNLETVKFLLKWIVPISINLL